MPRCILAGLFLLMLYAPLSAEDVLECRDVKGPYKECRISEFEVFGGVSNLSRTYRRWYSLSGHVLSNLIFEYYDDTHPSYTVVFRYDASDRLAERVETVIKSNGTVAAVYTYRYRYDQKNRMSESYQVSAAGKEGEKTLYHYDNLDRLDGIVIYDAGGREMYRQTYRYDLFGGKSETLHYSPDGNLLYRLRYKQYTRDERVGSSLISQYGLMDYRYLRKMDSLGNSTEEFDYRFTGEQSNRTENLVVYRKFDYVAR